ncbi:hypothetical protein YC2023_050913 [Brassica napus]
MCHASRIASMGFCRFSRWRYRSMILVFINRFYYRLVDRHRQTLKPSTFTDLYLVCELCLQNDKRRTKRRFDTRIMAPVRDKHPFPREREDEPIPLFDHFDDTRAAAKSSKCGNRAIGDTWDDYDRIFYNKWLSVSIEPTRFVDPDVIRSLGLISDLEDMFVELGMGNMATNPQVIYPELVRQFMATVNVYYAN